MEGTATAEATEAEGTGTRYDERKRSGRRPASMEFPEDLYFRLHNQSEVEERSMAAIVRQAVREYCDDQDRKRARKRAG